MWDAPSRSRRHVQGGPLWKVPSQTGNWTHHPLHALAEYPRVDYIDPAINNNRNIRPNKLSIQTWYDLLIRCNASKLCTFLALLTNTINYFSIQFPLTSSLSRWRHIVYGNIFPDIAVNVSPMKRNTLLSLLLANDDSIRWWEHKEKHTPVDEDWADGSGIWVNDVVNV